MKNIYLVFRINASYKLVTKELRKNRGGINIFYYTTKQGIDIVENDNIRSIPAGSVVVTDKAAIEACPSLKDKRLVRIDELFAQMLGCLDDEYFALSTKIRAAFTYNGFNLFLKFCFFKPCIADHPDVREKEFYREEEEYSIFLKSILQKMFNGRNIKYIITSDPGDLVISPGVINIIDRHASNSVPEDVYKNSLKLPLYENSADCDSLNLGQQFDHLIDQILSA